MTTLGGAGASPSVAASARLSPQVTVTGRKRKNPGPRPGGPRLRSVREGIRSFPPRGCHTQWEQRSSLWGWGGQCHRGGRIGARVAEVYSGPARLTALPVDICLDILRFLVS